MPITLGNYREYCLPQMFNGVEVPFFIFTGEPLPRVKMICALAVWVFYGAILQGRYLFRLTPKQVAGLCVVAFGAAVAVLWAIEFVSQRGPV